MSEHVYLIEATMNPHHNDGLRCHAIGLCGNPETALSMIHSAWPWATLRIVHSVRAENRSEMLYDVLRMKFKADHFKFNWYRLSPANLQFFESINDENYGELIRKLENESAEESGAKVRDVTRRRHSGTGRVQQAKPEPPAMTVEEIEELKRQYLSSIE
jgi:hypothetical protein